MLVFNTLRPRQNGRHFADDTFNRIFVNENVRILIKFSLKCVPKGPINNNPALFQIMAWRRPGDKPLSEPMMVSSLTHICVTRPQWVMLIHASRRGLWWQKIVRSTSQPHWKIFGNGIIFLMEIVVVLWFEALVQIMAWHRAGDKSLYEPMMAWFTAHICVTLPGWVKHDHLAMDALLTVYCAAFWYCMIPFVMSPMV